MRTVTPFDTSAHHIHVEFSVADNSGTPRNGDAVVDTGAPWTEFNDAFLAHAGLLIAPDWEIEIKPGLQTQKYTKITLPSLTLCGQQLVDFDVMVSRFDASWGIGALIGLDFFRRFKITIDYGSGALTCEPL